LPQEARLDEGDRIGIVGRNGDGKSSLLKMLAGRLEPNAGRVTRRGGVTLGVLDQTDELADDRTVHQPSSVTSTSTSGRVTQRRAT